MTVYYCLACKRLHTSDEHCADSIMRTGFRCIGVVAFPVATNCEGGNGSVQIIGSLSHSTEQDSSADC